MLGTLGFTLSEHWAPFNFPQGTALKIDSEVNWPKHEPCEPLSTFEMFFIRLSTAKKADIVTFLACIYLSIVLLFCDQFAAYQLTLALYWTPLEDRLDCASD